MSIADLVVQSAQRHLFSIYCNQLPRSAGSTMRIDDPIQVHRIREVLRLRTGDQCILFDATHHALSTVLAITLGKKGFVELRFDAVFESQPLTPTITLCVGVLKRNVWPEVVYAAAQMGVTQVYPLITERSAHEIPDQQRLMQVMIAACEQSKQYIMPQIMDPISLDQLAAVSAETTCWYADPHGAAMSAWVSRYTAAQAITVVVGPEAGLTDADITKLAAARFEPYALTPTVLRACDAVVVSLGIIRSFCRQ